jgi:hypothetical protein
MVLEAATQVISNEKHFRIFLACLNNLYDTEGEKLPREFAYANVCTCETKHKKNALCSASQS